MRRLIAAVEAKDAAYPRSIAGENAYRFLLEVICGLNSSSGGRDGRVGQFPRSLSARKTSGYFMGNLSAATDLNLL